MLKVKHVLSYGSRFGTQMAVFESSPPSAICSSSFYDANLILKIVLYEWYHIKLSLIHYGSDENWWKLWNLVLDTQILAPWIRRPRHRTCILGPCSGYSGVELNMHAPLLLLCPSCTADAGKLKHNSLSPSWRGAWIWFRFVISDALYSIWKAEVCGGWTW